MEGLESEGSAETSLYPDHFNAKSKLHPPMSTDEEDDSEGGRRGVGAHIVKVFNSSSAMAKDNVYVGENIIIMEQRLLCVDLSELRRLSLVTVLRTCNK